MDARAAFAGLSLGHDRGALVRAVLEGVAYGLRDCLDLLRELGVRADLGRASGGGARSENDGIISAPLAPGVSGTEALAAVSRRLGQAGIDVTELGLRLASLDEVFLTLTGGER